MDRGRCRGEKSPADRPAGQRRLLGHRDQARAGTRLGRLSGVHAQGHDRPLLRGLRQKIARRPPAAVSAIRHPQRAHRRRRDRRRRRRRGLRIPAPLRHGRSAIRCPPRRISRRGLPHLCTGGRQPRSSRLSGAAAPGERCQFLIRLRGRRFERADRRNPATSAKLHRQRAAGAQWQNSAAARPLSAGAERISRRRIRGSCRPRRAAAGCARWRDNFADGTSRAAARRRRAAGHRARRLFADRRQRNRHRIRRRRCHRACRHVRRHGRLRSLGGDAGRGARRGARTRR